MTSASAVARESRSAGLSDAGHVRTNNEDRIHFDDTAGLYFVVDGVGGEAAGERAAEIARRALIKNIDPESPDLQNRVRDSIALAGRDIFESARRNPSWAGMACVLTVAVVRGDKAIIGHVGDSRLYKIRGDSIQKITQDHSPVGQMEDSKQIPEAEAMRHPRRNEIFRDVGSKLRPPLEEDFIDISEIEFERDAALLLCSDGLTDEVGSADILSIIKRFAGDPSRVCRELIDLAKEHGGKDNVSVVYVEHPAFARTAAAAAGQTLTRIKNGFRPRGVLVGLLIGAVLGVAATWYYLQRADTPPPVSSPSAARTLVVDPASTIADALEQANAGDVVELLPGVYSERVRMKTGVWIVARVPGSVEFRPQVSAESSGPAVTASGVRNTGISGIVIEAGAGQESSWGVLVEESEVVLQQLDVSGASDAAIVIRGNSVVSLNSAAIHDNPGAGIAVSGPVKLEVVNSSLLRNGGKERAAIEVDESVKADIRGNLFGANGSLLRSPNQRAAETELRKLNVVLGSEPQRPGR